MNWCVDEQKAVQADGIRAYPLISNKGCRWRGIRDLARTALLDLLPNIVGLRPTVKRRKG
jgi:hypothetical protein